MHIAVVIVTAVDMPYLFLLWLMHPCSHVRYC